MEVVSRAAMVGIGVEWAATAVAAGCVEGEVAVGRKAVGVSSRLVELEGSVEVLENAHGHALGYQMGWPGHHESGKGEAHAPRHAGRNRQTGSGGGRPKAVLV